MTTYWWLSFADASRPKGQTNLGVAIVRGRDLGDALARAWELGCNPGGEVAGMEVPLEALGLTEDDIGPGRRLTDEELHRLGVKQSMKSIG